MPKVMTANNLRTGDVVYLASDGSWVRDLACAHVAQDADAEARLETTAQAAEARQDVISTYLFDVKLDGAVPAALSVRERIRAALGPTV